jgi:hypothetical protein
MRRARRTRLGILILASVVALIAFETPARATHVFPNSFASCERQDATTGTFRCNLTIVIGQEPFPGPVVVRADEEEVIGVRVIGATFATVPTRAGGTCAATPVVPFGTGVTLVLTGDLLSGCTIILQETLTAQPPAEVCHSLLAVVTNSVSQVVACVPLLPPLTEPTTREQCKQDGWRTFQAGFKNQGDCVSFVATKGKTPHG